MKVDEQKGTSSKSIGSVNTTCELSTSEKTRNGFLVRVMDCRVGTDLETSHGVVKYGCL